MPSAAALNGAALNGAAARRGASQVPFITAVERVQVHSDAFVRGASTMLQWASNNATQFYECTPERMRQRVPCRQRHTIEKAGRVWLRLVALSLPR